MHQVTKPVLVLAAVLLAGYAVAQPMNNRPPAAPRVAGQSADPFAEVSLPYNGYGEVSILDDGEIAILLGGEPAADDNQPSGEILGAVGLSFNAARTQLLQTSQAWLIDVGGRQLAAMGLAERDILSRRAFVLAPPEDVRPATRQSLVDLRGEMRLDFDAKTSIGSLWIEDRQTESDTGGAELIVHFSVPNLPEQQELDLEPVEGVEGAQTCACTASCDRGTCTISCTYPERCSCFCTNRGVPVCRCQSHGQVELLP